MGKLGKRSLPNAPEVVPALIWDPLDNSNEVLLSVTIFEILIHSGKCFMIDFTFLTKLAAVPNLVAITRMFLSR